MPGEDPVDGVGTGGRNDRRILLEFGADLPGAPAALLSDLEDALHDDRGGGMRTGLGPMGTVLEAAETLVLKTSEPLVTGGTADVVATAKFGVREVGELGFEGEAGALVLST